MTGWRKSSRCASGECVEAGNGPGIIAVRDSADRDGPVLSFSREAWHELTWRLKGTRRRTIPDDPGSRLAG